jgi:hypothetical protein
MKSWILVFAVMLSGCAPSAEERTANFTVMPEGLKDCKVYRISDGSENITVVRCPNSSTTSRIGKTKKTVTTID